MRSRHRSSVLVVLVCLLAAAGLGGCRSEGRYGDDLDDPGGSTAGQCDLPLDQRHGGWVCP